MNEAKEQPTEQQIQEMISKRNTVEGIEKAVIDKDSQINNNKGGRGQKFS